jgi:signal transduction histidine kinase
MRVDGLVAYRGPNPFRLRPILGERHARLEERQAERKRIAQYLHDTVLQDFFGASMQLHVALDLVPANSPAKLSLSRVLVLMERVIADVRRSVGGLRSSSTESRDLAEALARVPQELGIEERTGFRVIIVGSARQLHPVIHEEMYRIGREALMNAFRHSRASRIEVELEYGAKRFSLGVRDNGCGIDPQVLHSGRNGHWGLVGMRERAEGIGASLRVRSRIANGTELLLSVPNRVAFG